MLPVVPLVSLPVVPFVPAHVGAAPLELRFAVAVVAGLFGVAPGRVTRRQADIAHYGAGLLAALLFELVVVGLEGARDATVGTALVLASVLMLADLLAALLMVGVLYGFFASLVFPRYGDHLFDDEDRRERVRAHWLVSASVYGLALLAGVVVLYGVLGRSAVA